MICVLEFNKVYKKTKNKKKTQKQKQTRLNKKKKKKKKKEMTKIQTIDLSQKMIFCTKMFFNWGEREREREREICIIFHSNRAVLRIITTIITTTIIIIIIIIITSCVSVTYRTVTILINLQCTHAWVHKTAHETV